MLEGIQEITYSEIANLVMACILVAIGVKWLFKKDDKLEEIKKALYDLGHMLQALGFVFLDDVVRDLAAGDITGAVRNLKEIVKLSKDKAKLIAHMKEVYLTGIEYLMDNDLKFCEEIKKRVNNKYVIEQQEAQTKADQLEAARLLEAERAEEAAEIAEARKLVKANKAKELAAAK